MAPSLGATNRKTLESNWMSFWNSYSALLGSPRRPREACLGPSPSLLTKSKSRKSNEQSDTRGLCFGSKFARLAPDDGRYLGERVSAIPLATRLNRVDHRFIHPRLRR